MLRHSTLAINPTPFKSSFLSIPPSPFSPRSPLTPATRSQPQSRKPNLGFPQTTTPPTPCSPLKWLWTCHACANTYALGTTRRCLNDGHHFCAGTSVVTTWRKGSTKKRVKKHRACKSEFDYTGWKAWGRWKRSTSLLQSKCSNPVEERKNCWLECDYPSQCRWGKSVGIHTPTPTRTEFDVAALSTPMDDMPTLNECFSATHSPTDVEQVILGKAFETSTKKQKSSGSTSPLSSSSHPEAFNTNDPPTQSNEEISCIDPSLLAIPYPSLTPPLSFPTSAPANPTKALRSKEEITRLLHIHTQNLCAPLQGVHTTDPSRSGLDEFSPLERGGVWNERAGVFA